VDDDALLGLLRRFQAEGVRYILVGGHAVRLNGFVRATEDIDILLPSSLENGKRVIRALEFLPSSADLQPEWFEVPPGEPENIRVEAHGNVLASTAFLQGLAVEDLRHDELDHHDQRYEMLITGRAVKPR